MKPGVVVAGLWVMGVIGLVAGCGSSDGSKQLVKWTCRCNPSVCASTDGDAAALYTQGGCVVGSSWSPETCETTGDICACPGGADKCVIARQ